VYVFCLVRLDWSACDAKFKIDALSITHKLGKNKEGIPKNSMNPPSFRHFRLSSILYFSLIFLSEYIIFTQCQNQLLEALNDGIIPFSYLQLYLQNLTNFPTKHKNTCGPRKILH
jgi:hypothetical protein